MRNDIPECSVFIYSHRHTFRRISQMQTIRIESGLVAKSDADNTPAQRRSAALRTFDPAQL